MENKIIFHQNIDDDPTDFTRLQDFAESSLDHVVLDGISDRTKYTGFGVVKSAVTQITVDPGRLYSAGKVYASASTAWSKDFITQLPVAGKKIAAVVTWGSESDTDVRPRQFLINAETRQAEPQAVPLVHSRVANLNVVIGTEAPDPSAPLVDVGYTIIALVVLTSSVIPELGVTSRYAQITLGTEWGRTLINPDLWADTWAAGVEDGESVMNDSVRFPNEETAIHGLGGFTILIVRPGTKPAKFKWGWIGEKLHDWFGVLWGAHDSERTDLLQPDYVIHNDASVEQLYLDIDAAVRHWEENGRSSGTTEVQYGLATLALSRI